MVGRLVEQQDVGLLEDDASEVDASLFAAGQLGKELRALCARDFQTVAHLIDLEIVVVTAECVQFLLERTVAVQQAVVVGVLLHLGFQLVHRGAYLVCTGKGCAQNVLDGGGGVVDRHLVDDTDRAARADGDVTVVVGQTAGDDVQERGLARTVRP